MERNDIRMILWLLPLCILALCVAPVAAEDIGGTMGWYDVYCNVDGATVYFDGQNMGQIQSGKLSVPVYSTGAPYSAVRVTASGYNSASEALPPSPSAGGHAVVSVTLSPLAPTTGTLKATSTPSGAMIHVDGAIYGTTPHSVTLSPGMHSVQLTYNGYQPWSNTVKIQSGSTTTISPVLTPAQTQGSVSFISNPPGAHVTFDGGYIGFTPYTMGGVSKGAHIVEFSLPGYVEWSSTIHVYPGQTTYVSESLTPMAQPTTGSLRITTSPSYASVYMDGVYYGTSSPGTGVYIGSASAGTHTISATLSGYQTATSSVTVTAGKTTSISLVLQSGTSPTPTPSPSGSGSLQVSSSPAGAVVYLNDVNKGITPTTLPNVGAGTYAIILKLTGYQDWNSQVSVAGGQTAQVSAVLNPVAQPTKSPVSPLLLPVGILGAVALFVALRRNEP